MFGDVAGAAATHAAEADLVIIDEVPPFLWRGSQAFQAWAAWTRTPKSAALPIRTSRSALPHGSTSLLLRLRETASGFVTLAAHTASVQKHRLALCEMLKSHTDHVA